MEEHEENRLKIQNECVTIFTKLDITNRKWKEDVDVRDFIQKNYKAYEGDASFLSDPTEATNMLWGELQKLQKEERRKNGVLDMETEVVS